MSKVLDLVPAEHPVLREKCRIADGGDVLMLVADLFTTCQHYNAAGLAAPQVGIPLRVAVIHVDGARFALINPEWDPPEGESDVVVEGCLSLPGIHVPVRRWKSIGLRRRAHSRSELVTGFTARVIQHELDHLDGILITDHGQPIEDYQGWGKVQTLRPVEGVPR